MPYRVLSSYKDVLMVWGANLLAWLIPDIDSMKEILLHVQLWSFFLAGIYTVLKILKTLRDWRKVRAINKSNGSSK